YVRDPARLVELGKALFWDMQAGSDGRTACATCHFHAGADHRSQNQLANSQSSSGGQVSVNRLLTSQDFPFHALSNPDDNRSAVLRDSSAVTGSAGVFRRLFQDVTAGPSESGADSSDAVFSRNGGN